MWWELLKKEIWELLKKELPLSLNIELEDASEKAIKIMKKHCEHCLFWNIP